MERDGRQILRACHRAAGRQDPRRHRRRDRAMFSPDSQWLAFPSGNALKKIPLTGGAPVHICSLTTGSGVGTAGFVDGHWGADDTIAFVPQFNAGIWSVPASGGEPKLVLAAERERPHCLHLSRGPAAAPRAPVHTRAKPRPQYGRARDCHPRGRCHRATNLIQGGTNARYIPTGHLVYGRGDTVLAVPFNLSRLAVTGARGAR